MNIPNFRPQMSRPIDVPTNRRAPVCDPCMSDEHPSDIMTTYSLSPSASAQSLQRSLSSCGSRIAIAPYVSNTLRTPDRMEVTLPARRSRFKLACHAMSNICFASMIPSFALLVLGPIGLVAPAALLLSGMTLSLLSGRMTRVEQDELNARIAQRRNEVY